MPLGGFATAALVTSVAAPVIGGIIGSMNSASDREAAQRASAAAFAEIEKIGAPPDQSKAIILKHFKQAGLYTPQLEQQIDVGISKASQIQENPALKDTQMQALNLIKERAAGGLNAQDRANLNNIRNQAAIDQQGKLESIRQNMAARGLSGSGAELAQQLGAAQSAGSEEAAGSDRMAAQAQQAALQAAMQSGQLGGQIRSQDFDVEKAKADAADRFKMFDVQNSVARQQRNVGSGNQGQLYNLGEEQRLSDANTGMDNSEKMRQNAAQRQYWQDQANLASMKANARTGQANQLQGQANSTAQQWAGIGGGVGGVAGSLLNYMGNQKKTDKVPNATPGTESALNETYKVPMPGDPDYKYPGQK